MATIEQLSSFFFLLKKELPPISLDYIEYTLDAGYQKFNSKGARLKVHSHLLLGTQVLSPLNTMRVI
jgi:hypothetical protein